MLTADACYFCQMLREHRLWRAFAPGATSLERQDLVESECGAVAVGRTYLLPPLSSDGASLVRPWLRFHTPLINRTCRFPASGSRTRLHAFTHDGPRPSCVRRTSRKCP